MDELGFVAETTAAPTAVRAAGAAAVGAVPAGPARLVEVSANAGSVRYDVLGADDVALMVLRVSWHELGAGARRVTLSVHGHQVLGRRLLGRRIGRPVVPGRDVAEAFARELRARLR